LPGHPVSAPSWAFPLFFELLKRPVFFYAIPDAKPQGIFAGIALEGMVWEIKLSLIEAGSNHGGGESAAIDLIRASA
jgi:hypothetical protein